MSSEVDLMRPSKKIFKESYSNSRRKIFEEEKEPDYSDGVPVAVTSDGRLLKIDVSPTMAVGFFGPSKSGKTTGMNSFATRCYDLGRTPVNAADTDMVFQSYDRKGGVSKKLQDKMGLAPNEKPHSIPKKIVSPKFQFDKTSSYPSSYEESFTFGFQDLNRSELNFLLGNDLSSKQKGIVSLLLDQVSLDGDTSFEDFRRELDNLDINTNVAKTIESEIDVLENESLVSNRYRVDFLKYLKEGDALSLGLGCFNKLHSSYNYLAEFYSAQFLQKIFDGVYDGYLDPGFICLIAEAHHLMPAGEDSLLADKVKRLLTYHKRRVDMPVCLDSQSPEQIPGEGDSKNILGELNHAFIGCDDMGKPLSPEGSKKILKSMSIVTRPNKEYPAWIDKISDLSHHEFLYVNPKMDDPSDAPVVRFLAPLVSNP